LDPEDEAALDRYEGVPSSYQKQTLNVEIINGEACGELRDGKRFVDIVVYVDNTCTGTGAIRQEYIRRMSLAIENALNEGVPEQYIDRYIRPVLNREDK
jgi:gamma-glutamylcyclotransferase